MRDLLFIYSSQILYKELELAGLEWQSWVLEWFLEEVFSPQGHRLSLNPHFPPL
jgi:hypothetical protein